ncbi:MAG: hypothetical protein JXQ97_15475 [Natronospirillum sp.]
MLSIIRIYLIKNTLLGIAVTALSIFGFIASATWFSLSENLSAIEKIREILVLNLSIGHLLVPLVCFTGAAIGLGRMLASRELIIINSSAPGRRGIKICASLSVMVIMVFHIFIIEIPAVKEIHLDGLRQSEPATNSWYSFNDLFIKRNSETGAKELNVAYFHTQDNQIVEFGDELQRNTTPLYRNAPTERSNEIAYALDVVASGIPRPAPGWSYISLINEYLDAASPWSQSADLLNLLSARTVQIFWSLPMFFLLLSLVTDFNRKIALSTIVGKMVLALIVVAILIEASFLLLEKMNINYLVRTLVPISLSILTTTLFVKSTRRG